MDREQLSAFGRRQELSAKSQVAVFHSFTVSVSLRGYGCKSMIINRFKAAQFHSLFFALFIGGWVGGGGEGGGQEGGRGEGVVRALI